MIGVFGLWLYNCMDGLDNNIKREKKTIHPFSSTALFCFKIIISMLGGVCLAFANSFMQLIWKTEIIFWNIGTDAQLNSLLFRTSNRKKKSVTKTVY